MAKKTFMVEGMHCESCAQLVEIALEETAGVISAKVDFSSEKAAVEYDAAAASEKKITEAIKAAGYSAKAVSG